MKKVEASPSRRFDVVNVGLRGDGTCSVIVADIYRSRLRVRVEG